MAQSEIQPGILYTKEHEWIVIDNDVATIGITDYAQQSLGDLVYVELPEVGKNVEPGKEIAVVESCKAASDVYAPLTGEIIEVNDELSGTPETINQAPYTGWIFKMRISKPDELSGMMDASQYEKYLEAAA